MAEKSTFYKDTMPRLIKQYKSALEDCLIIAGDKIDTDLNDDKIFNALKGRKEAGEQVKYYAKEIESIENDINGVKITEKKEVKGAEKFTKE